MLDLIEHIVLIPGWRGRYAAVILLLPVMCVRIATEWLLWVINAKPRR